MTHRALLPALLSALMLGGAPTTGVDAQERRGIFGRERDPVERLEELNPPYDGRFQFVRLRFDAAGGRGGFGFGRRQPPWMHDYPRAERNFMRILDETTTMTPWVEASHILSVGDPELFRHPVAYIVEVGFWDPTDEEAAALGAYLRKGGFLIVDDFRSERELQRFRYQIDRVLPGAQLIRLDDSHEIFDSFFHIESLENIVPPTFQQLPPIFFGIYEENDPQERLLAIVNFNNDIAEYWEFSDRGYYPIDLSNEAYKLGVNYVVYAMSH